MIQGDLYTLAEPCVRVVGFVSVGNPVTYNIFRPAEGERWLVLLARGQQGDVANHDCFFGIEDLSSGGTALNFDPVSRATNEPHYLHAADGETTSGSCWLGPIVLDHNMQLYFGVSGLPVGQQNTCWLYYLKVTV